MSKWSDKNTDVLCTELINAILVVKGATTQIFRKVSSCLSAANLLIFVFRPSLQSLQTWNLYHFEVFMQEELLVNITHHELVPKHMILSDAEKAELLKR